MTLRFAAVPPSAMLQGGAAVTLRCALASLASANAGDVLLNSIWDSDAGVALDVPASVNSAPCGGGSGRRAAATTEGGDGVVLRGGNGRAAQAAAPPATPSASALPPGAGSIAVFIVGFPVSASVADSDGTGGAVIQDMAARSQAAAAAITQATAVGDCSSAAGSSCCGLATTSLCPFLTQLSAASGVPLSALSQNMGRTSLGAPLLPSPHPAAANPASMGAGGGGLQLGPAPLGGVIASAALVLACAGVLAVRRQRRKAHAKKGDVRSKGAAAFSPRTQSPAVHFTSMNPMWAREVGGAGGGDDFVGEDGNGNRVGDFVLTAQQAPLHVGRLATVARSSAGRSALGRGPRATPLLGRAPSSADAHKEALRHLPAAVTEFSEEEGASDEWDGAEPSLQQQLSRTIQTHVARSIEAASSAWLHPPGELRKAKGSSSPETQLRSPAARPGAFHEPSASTRTRSPMHPLLPTPAAEEVVGASAGSPLEHPQLSTSAYAQVTSPVDAAQLHLPSEREEGSMSLRADSLSTVSPQIRTKWPPVVPRGSAPGALSGPGASSLARALSEAPRSQEEELGASEEWGGEPGPLEQQQLSRSTQRPVLNVENRAHLFSPGEHGESTASVGATSPGAAELVAVTRSPADPGALSESSATAIARAASPLLGGAFKHSSLRG